MLKKKNRNPSCSSNVTSNVPAPRLTDYQEAGLTAIEKRDPPPRRWLQKETKHLKLAMRAIGNPQTPADWQNISNMISDGRHSAEECREQAVKLRLLTQRNSVDQQKSKKCNDDFFAGRSCNETMFDVNMNDSLLSVLNTPPTRVRFKRRPVLLRQVFDESWLLDEYSVATEFPNVFFAI